MEDPGFELGFELGEVGFVEVDVAGFGGFGFDRGDGVEGGAAEEGEFEVVGVAVEGEEPGGGGVGGGSGGRGGAVEGGVPFHGFADVRDGGGDEGVELSGDGLFPAGDGGDVGLDGGVAVGFGDLGIVAGEEAGGGGIGGGFPGHGDSFGRGIEGEIE